MINTKQSGYGKNVLQHDKGHTYEATLSPFVVKSLTKSPSKISNKTKVPVLTTLIQNNTLEVLANSWAEKTYTASKWKGRSENVTKNLWMT